ncbi:Uncharacterized protein OBRU01_11689 [Operophtera brumata]|uniref:Small lysine-rich protein 1 n=1 Tax=Operophtera brumata TaxID=104452 RepID=A0A0L7LBK5_OPEBR|nr:Uncharacterized protein OBRU01_11689 [Operophtera brumata]
MADEEKKGSKEETGKKKGKGKKAGEVDFLCEAAMDNVYYVCHNVQELLASRGYLPPGYVMKKKKGKK